MSIKVMLQTMRSLAVVQAVDGGGLNNIGDDVMTSLLSAIIPRMQQGGGPPTTDQLALANAPPATMCITDQQIADVVLLCHKMCFSPNTQFSSSMIGALEGLGTATGAMDAAGMPMTQHSGFPRLPAATAAAVFVALLRLDVGVSGDPGVGGTMMGMPLMIMLSPHWRSCQQESQPAQSHELRRPTFIPVSWPSIGILVPIHTLVSSPVVKDVPATRC